MCQPTHIESQLADIYNRSASLFRGVLSLNLICWYTRLRAPLVSDNQKAVSRKLNIILPPHISFRYRTALRDAGGENPRRYFRTVLSTVLCSIGADVLLKKTPMPISDYDTCRLPPGQAAVNMSREPFAYRYFIWMNWCNIRSKICELWFVGGRVLPHPRRKSLLVSINSLFELCQVNLYTVNR